MKKPTNVTKSKSVAPLFATPAGNAPAVISNRATRRKLAKKTRSSEPVPSIAVLPPDPRLIGRGTVGQLLHHASMKRQLAAEAQKLWNTEPDQMNARHKAIIDWIFLSIANNGDAGFGSANGPGVDLLGEIMQVKAGFASTLIPKKGWRGDNKGIMPNVALGWAIACAALIIKLETSNLSANEAADAVIDAIIENIGTKLAKRLFDVRNRNEAGETESMGFASKRPEMRNRLINYHAKLVGGESLIPKNIDAGGLDYKMFRSAICEIEEARQRDELAECFKTMIRNACNQFRRVAPENFNDSLP